jgi:hypothetical protein
MYEKKRSLADKYMVRSKFIREVLVFGFRTSGREVDRRAYLFRSSSPPPHEDQPRGVAARRAVPDR